MTFKHVDPTIHLPESEVKAKYQEIYQKGLKDGLLVMERLSTAYDLQPSTKEEDIGSDIDCWINGDALSIKALHAGLKYNNIYFELSTQRYQGCDGVAKVWDPKWSQDIINNQVASKCYQFHNGHWFPGWYYYGLAPYYAILQGTTINIYAKDDIQAHVAAKGWLRVLGLSYKTKAIQGGKDTICGFLNTADIPSMATFEMS